MSLDAKTKLGFIDGSIPKPQSESDPSYRAWCKSNSMVLAWLFNSLTNDIPTSVIYLSLLGSSGLICYTGILKAMALGFLS